jgi:hypothetical protein
MKTITIGNSEARNTSPIDASWIRDRVRELRSHNTPVCVKVRIKVSPVDIILKTPGCSDTEPNSPRKTWPEEDRLFDLWERRGMKREDFDVDQLIAFVKDIQYL